ncbi:glutamine-hydrolyzing GMP synthase [Candidatus Pseudomonas adelgestsugas]|uniref:GMP synthase [glutamine-hydrolyzing] n=1 Tax=Candidatus Pseudomonas adelgestsugas TaxID=1302376 RepID=A0ABX5RAM5_9PSED|nr:glutamine-hydrolyzing GMP synthase [Candidatus Pseudomonas adelgestsugas]QAX82248.1 GMP synthase [glutamine-hydrolyzing] [Candidatus Pseudomonas adelgestsugas]
MVLDINAHRILIIDFGSQYTQLIARRVRELGVYCELHSFNINDAAIRKFAPKGIILAGGPESVYKTNSPCCPQAVFDLGVPVFGICYGMQIMAKQLGGKVESSRLRECGYARLNVVSKSRLLDGIEDHVDTDGMFSLDVWMSHGDIVTKMPKDFHVLASTTSCQIAGMFREEHCYYGVQFHPEVTHTKQGSRILSRFIFDICKCRALWTPLKIIEDTIISIRAKIGTDNVLLGLSGGVDSSVAAVLLHQAIGNQLTCMFIDNGLLRLHEGKQVMSMLTKHIGVNMIYVNAQDQFLNNLAGVSDPEKKRRIIGRTFIDVFDTQSSKLDNIKYLAQGTIYPDVIESSGSTSTKVNTIKSHHNVGGLPMVMNLKLIEPLRKLFKDEVRRLGLELGLPYEMVYRHPFPGPGLGVRILGDVKKEYVDLLRLADYIFIEELHKADWYYKVSQAFAVFQPLKSVSIVGDSRRYAWVLALRAVETIDFMTARWAHLPYELLETISGRIVNEIEDVSRVTYDVSNKPPATIEWE